jgi:hypothetical protein
MMAKILAPLLMWLAQTLINHFLNTNIQLRKELQDAIDRNREHTDSLITLQAAEVKNKTLLESKGQIILALEKQLEDADEDINDLRLERANKLKEYENEIGKLGTDDLLNSDLSAGASPSSREG